MADSGTTAFDVAVVGGGVGGICSVVAAVDHGLTAQGFEAASGLGGTWYRNRYPGARCDIESLEYSFGFDPELQQDWVWSERFAGQPEILRYLDHAIARHDIASHFRCGTVVETAVFDDTTRMWHITTSAGDAIEARWLIAATGGHSVPRRSEFPGQGTFGGTITHTADWPDQLDVRGQKVAVIGTGPSGIQCIPELAEYADTLYVLQRTPNYVVPAHNAPVDPSYESLVKSSYRDFRRRCAANAIGIGAEFEPSRGASTDAPEPARMTEFGRRWTDGGFTFVFAYDDMGSSVDLAESAGRFIRNRIAEVVDDDAVAQLLSPSHTFGARRLCVGSDYYETFNRNNVELIDLRVQPISAFNSHGIELQGLPEPLDLRTSAKLDGAEQAFGTNRQLDVDLIVLATGFEDQTSALRSLHIEGPTGATLTDLWRDRPTNYLGMLVAGLPNLFMVNGPGSPSITTNMIANAEHNVGWIFGCIAAAAAAGVDRIEAEDAAQADWTSKADLQAAGSLIFLDSSRYVGSSPAGAAHVLPYIGVADYLREITSVASNGYPGCHFGEPTSTRTGLAPANPSTDTSAPHAGSEEPRTCATSFSFLP